MSSGPVWLIQFLTDHHVSNIRGWFAILMRESGGSATCIYPSGSPKDGNWARDNAPYWDTGLAQINNRHLSDMRKFFGEPNADMRLMLNAEKNFAYAMHLTNGGRYFGDWGLKFNTNYTSYSFDWTGWPEQWVADNAAQSEAGFKYWWDKYPDYAHPQIVPQTPKTDPKPVVPPPAKPVVSLSKVQPGLSNGDIKTVQLALNKVMGTALSVDGQFGPRTKTAYSRWQQKLGYTGSAADGVPGIRSLTELGKRFGFTVKS